VFHHHFADETRGRDAVHVEGQRVAVIHAKRRGIDDDVPAMGIVRSGFDCKRRIVLMQACRETFRRSSIGIEEAEACDAILGQRRDNSGADTAAADYQCACAGNGPSLALDAADEALAVEHVTDQPPLTITLHRVAGAADLHGDARLVEESDGRHLVRHGDEGARDIAQPEHQPQEIGIVSRLAAHGHDNGVDALGLEPRIVDHRRLEALGRNAEMGDDPGAA